MNGRRLLAAGLVLVLTGSGAWAWWFRTNPQLAKARALSDQLFSQPFEGGPPREEMRDQFRELRDTVEALPEAERQQFRDEQEQRMMAREEERMAKFFALSPDERVAEIDKMIDRMASFRQEREKRRAEREARGETGDRRGRGDRGPGPGGPGFGEGGGPGSPGSQGQGGGRGDGMRGGPGGWGGWGRGNGDPQQMAERRRARLDGTTPEYRAQRDEYMQLVRQRMQQRGMTPPGFFR